MTIAEPLGWSKKLKQLTSNAKRSPYLAKVVSDYHWLEIELASQANTAKERDRLRPELLNPNTVAALNFANSLARFHRRLPKAGKRALEGRLRDSLKSDFAGLFLEIDVATTLILDGYTISLPDMEGSARYDISFFNKSNQMSLECKSVSVDAGRKIHRRDFYRFVSRVDGLTPDTLPGGRRIIVIVTIEDRFPSNDGQQQQLRNAVHDIIHNESKGDTFDGEFFSISSEPWETRFDDAVAQASGNMNAAARILFGDTCHAAGVAMEHAACFLIVTSRQEDDTSKSVLDAMKAAAKQLPKDRPGFIALQYEEITARDLSSPSLRGRAALLANYLFQTSDTAHVAAVYHTAFAGLSEFQGVTGKPAFAIWNAECAQTCDQMPFRQGVSNTLFAELLGAERYESDDHVYDTEE